ncbi:hypothetical protein MMC29_002263 [Sticta canariensis]|nr:hypothetical protein [Sticta canariensis]
MLLFYRGEGVWGGFWTDVSVEMGLGASWVVSVTTENWVAVGVFVENSDDAITKEAMLVGVVGMKASRTEDVGTDLTGEISTKLEDLGSTGGARGSGMGRVDSTTKEGFVVGVVGIAASRTEDVGIYLTGGASTKPKDLGPTDRATGSGMGRVDSTTEGFVVGAIGIASSRTEGVGIYLTRGVSTKPKDVGPTGRVTSSVMGRVDGWIGIRERFWPACACRATSEIARPVGTGGPRAKVDSGTGPVADRGRCGDLAIMPVGIGKSPVPKCCRGGLATRPQVVEDSTSTNKPSMKALKSFILGEDNQMGAEIASAF